MSAEGGRGGSKLLVAEGSVTKMGIPYGGFPKFGGSFLGIPITRTLVYWGLYWGTRILGNCHVNYCIYPLWLKFFHSNPAGGCSIQGRNLEHLAVPRKPWNPAPTEVAFGGSFKKGYRAYVGI